MRPFEDDLQDALAYHGSLCVGQILGVRLARRGLLALDIHEPRSCRDLVTFVETDRCIADAISTVTGC
ncbi:MAG: formylmethanofuran dehydrogenase subunit E family protein, partial [Spirochaetaceae bacterium]|nr:formylmethanofuran dehydrogenase subunit E family protein [Spirochaetaceae bacterium]